MLRGLVEQVMLTFRLIRDPRVPILAKIIAFLPVIYVVSPIDIVPDFIPVLGQLDDISIVLLGMRLFESMVPADIVNEHRLAIKQGGARSFDVLENVEYHIHEEGDKKKRR